MTKKVLIVLGTRPEAIKLAPVILLLKKAAPGIQTVVCSTSQHKEMLKQALRIFDIKPDHDLSVMREGQTLFEVTSEVLKKISFVFEREKPDMLCVQGDTTTAMAASLAGYYSKCRIAHVEAGLRTQDKFNPFPEEANRRITDILTDLHFAPTLEAKRNLLREGARPSTIFVTGNTVVDALLLVLRKLKGDAGPKVQAYFESKHGLDPRKETTVLVTAHRRESFGHDLHEMCLAVRDLARERRDLRIVFPVHLNPRVQLQVRRVLSGARNVHLIEPLDYLHFVFMMKHAALILTDSGGIQEEAPSLGVPVIVMRKRTERPEGIAKGAALLTGTKRSAIVEQALRLLRVRASSRGPALGENPYGDGQASRRIVKVMLATLSEDRSHDRQKIR